MPDDYADSARRRDAYKKRRKPQSRNSHGRYKDDRFGWILPLIVLIVFVAGLFYFKFHPRHNSPLINESAMHASSSGMAHQEVPVHNAQANWSNQQQYLKAKTTAPATATPVTAATTSTAIQAPITNQTLDAQPPATTQTASDQTPAATTTDQTTTDSSAPASSAADQKYDYYNMLPKMRVGQPTNKREQADDEDTDNTTDTDDSDTDDATVDSPVNMKAPANLPLATVKASPIKPAPVKATSVKITPITSPSTATAGAYQLQLGAFRNRTQAQALINRLHDHHLPLQIVLVQYNNTAWYRVIAGPYASAAKTQQMQKTLRAAGIDSIVHNP